MLQDLGKLFGRLCSCSCCVLLFWQAQLKAEEQEKGCRMQGNKHFVLGVALIRWQHGAGTHLREMKYQQSKGTAVQERNSDSLLFSIGTSEEHESH